MSLKPYYAQKCPSCRKVSSYDVELLGFEVSCYHCGHCYEARDGDQQSAAIEDPVHFWINFTHHDLDKINGSDASYHRYPK